ncbi:MAG: diphthine--ammonia ligase [Candidatus Bathyarchaeia archaeon]|jgi:uncharacterized protein (TIGR00290 family)
MVQKAVFSWSGGKDSALALYEIKKTEAYEVLRLMTTVTEEYDRVSIHGVRRMLLEEQAASLGFPLDMVFISRSISDAEYVVKMEGVLSEYLTVGVSSIVFGDIFLEEVRRYREDNLSKVGMKGIFPNWKKDTSELAKTFIDLGFKAIITCVDSKALDKKFVGRVFDEQFLSDLPSSVDPCGENGEFHSFAYDGPIFQRRIRFETGEVVFREGRFYYCDLLPE